MKYRSSYRRKRAAIKLASTLHRRKENQILMFSKHEVNIERTKKKNKPKKKNNLKKIIKQVFLLVQEPNE